MTWEQFMNEVREYNKAHHITDESPQVEKLKTRIMLCGKLSKEEIIALHEDVKDFFKSDASKEDKNMLRGYTESLSIIMDAIKRDLL